MTDLPLNDNEAPRRDAHAGSRVSSPDPMGQAALLLVESLLHGLVARSALSVADAVEIVETAAEVKAEIAEDLGDTPAAMRESLALLGAIHASLSIDLPPA